MKASDLMVKCLLNEKVEYIFGLPGEENIEFLDALSSSSIKFITTRHEQGAAFMADVYGRIKHRAGVCLATLGPGAMNLTTGVANANLDHSPLVAITGQGDIKDSHLQHHQYLDVIKAFEPITKWNSRITSSDTIPEMIHTAFRTAQMEKQGATHLELPNDVAAEKTSAKPLKFQLPPKFHPDSLAIKKAVELINRSSYPLILAGNGIFRNEASHALVAFAEATSIPVAKTFMSKGSISSGHPMSVGVFGLQVGDVVVSEFERSDCVIAIGYDVEEYSPQFWNPKMDKKIISIDAVPEPYIDRYYDVDVELIGDLSYTLETILGMVKKRGEWDKITKEKVSKAKKDYTPSFPIKPQHFLTTLREAMNPQDILVSDVGMHKLWISRLFETYEPNTVIISNGLASMGIALPGAMGAKLAKPDCNVVSVSGDGGFMMNLQELETAKRLGIIGTHIVWTDNSYGLIEWKQQKDNKKPFGVNFTNPDFLKLAQSFGISGYKVERASELGEILKTAIKSKELSIIEVPVDRKEYSKISSIAPGASV